MGERGAQGPQGKAERGLQGPKGEIDQGVSPEMLARLSRLEQRVAAAFFETPAAYEAASRASPMTHIADLSQEVRRSEVHTTTQTVRTPPEMAQTRATVDIGRKVEPETGHMTSTAMEDASPNGPHETGRAPQDGYPERKRNGSSNWVYWALPLLALAGLGSYFVVSDRSGRQIEDVPPVVTGPRIAWRPWPT
jgi:hypothetical protein